MARELIGMFDPSEASEKLADAIIAAVDDKTRRSESPRVLDASMFEYGATVADGLEQVLSSLSAGRPVVLDLRPAGGAGSSIRVEVVGDRLQAQVRRNIYWPRSMTPDERDRLVADGWSEVDRSPSSSWPLSDRGTAATTRLTRAIETLGGDPEELLLTTGAEDDWLPPCAHAVTFWDWKEPVPLREFTTACSLLLGAGAKSIHFNESETGGDHYGLVMSGAALDQKQVAAAWDLYYWEVPDDGAQMAAVELDANGDYRVIQP